MDDLTGDALLVGAIGCVAIAKAAADRQELEAKDTAGDGPQLAQDFKTLAKAAKACRAQVATAPGGVLADENVVHRARNALRDLLGGLFRLRPGSDGHYLIVGVTHSPAALMQEVGAQLWIGSGGTLSFHKSLIERP